MLIRSALLILLTPSIAFAQVQAPGQRERSSPPSLSASC